MFGLVVSLGAFVGYVEQQGDQGAAALLNRFEALTMETGRRHGMTPVKTEQGGILLLSETQETTLAAASALTNEFSPVDGYVPVHVVGQPGGVVRLDDGETVELATLVRLTAHPGELQPGTRT